MNTTHWTRALVAALVLCAGVAAHAKVYECRDGKGRPLYTEQPNSSNCRAVNVNTGTFSSVPGYTPAKQSAELAGEQKAVAANNKQSGSSVQAAQKQLDDARKALEEGKKVRNGNERNYAKYLERIKGLEDTVKQREQALQQLKQQNGGEGK